MLRCKCGTEMYWKGAFIRDNGQVFKEYTCPKCKKVTVGDLV